MQITEKDLEDLIFDDLSQGGDRLRERGFYSMLSDGHTNKLNWFRQVNLGDYGIADIIGVTRGIGKLYIDLIELKNVPITCKDFDQVYRYKRGVKELITSAFRRPDKVRYSINTFLIGPSIESGHYIHNESPVKLYTFKFTINGFEFESHHAGWCRVNAKLDFRKLSFSDSCVISSRSLEQEEENG